MSAYMSVCRINNLILKPINAVYKILSRKIIYSLKHSKKTHFVCLRASKILLSVSDDEYDSYTNKIFKEKSPTHVKSITFQRQMPFLISIDISIEPRSHQNSIRNEHQMTYNY